MHNTLGDLNNYLFEQLERLNDDEELNTEEKFDKEIKRCKAITSVATNIINNAELTLEAIKYADECGTSNGIPKMLQIGTKDIDE